MNSVWYFPWSRDVDTAFTLLMAGRTNSVVHLYPMSSPMENTNAYLVMLFPEFRAINNQIIRALFSRNGLFDTCIQNNWFSKIFRIF
jgi:hypothetical protein